MPSCFICRNSKKTTYRNQGISYHRILKRNGIREQWLEFFKKCGKDLSKLNSSSSICSAHFKPEDVLKYKRTKLLTENAVPSIIVHQSKHAQTFSPETSTELTSTNVGVHTEINSTQTDPEDISPLPDETLLNQMLYQPNTSIDSFLVVKLLNPLPISESVCEHTEINSTQTDHEDISPLPDETHSDQMLYEPRTSTDSFLVENLLNPLPIIESVYEHTEMNSTQTDHEDISPLPDETHLDQMLYQPRTNTDSFLVENMLNPLPISESVCEHTEINSTQTDHEDVSPSLNLIYMDQMCF